MSCCDRNYSSNEEERDSYAEDCRELESLGPKIGDCGREYHRLRKQRNSISVRGITRHQNNVIDYVLKLITFITRNAISKPQTCPVSQGISWTEEPYSVRIHRSTVFDNPLRPCRNTWEATCDYDKKLIGHRVRGVIHATHCFIIEPTDKFGFERMASETAYKSSHSLFQEDIQHSLSQEDIQSSGYDISKLLYKIRLHTLPVWLIEALRKECWSWIEARSDKMWKELFSSHPAANSILFDYMVHHPETWGTPEDWRMLSNQELGYISQQEEKLKALEKVELCKEAGLKKRRGQLYEEREERRQAELRDPNSWISRMYRIGGGGSTGPTSVCL